ncbi:hypothetical protein [Rheinheimera salexigens]|uniref:Uncharacterized protein n=1 Tax=Rheinheimera salexigens TaxID=1628148 RepID=A0A1E7Q8D9_9GAMM|nr:hypothetical protein [Rheinheimera salexigens]OEY70361.1 hypothetical protein BI198_12840 [Rheinheimera salexigens]
MAVKGINFFESVEFLDLESEINRRNVISRSYYSAYNSIKEKITDVPQYSGVGCHESLCVYLKQTTDFKPENKRSAQRIGLFLTSLKSNRHRADYDLNMDITVQETNMLREQTREFLSLISETSFEKRVISEPVKIGAIADRQKQKTKGSHLKVIK